MLPWFCNDFLMILLGCSNDFIAISQGFSRWFATRVQSGAWRYRRNISLSHNIVSTRSGCVLGLCYIWRPVREGANLPEHWFQRCCWVVTRIVEQTILEKLPQVKHYSAKCELELAPRHVTQKTLVMGSFAWEQLRGACPMVMPLFEKWEAR